MVSFITCLKMTKHRRKSSFMGIFFTILCVSILPAISWYYAGYWRGRVVEQRETLKMLKQLKKDWGIK